MNHPTNSDSISLPLEQVKHYRDLVVEQMKFLRSYSLQLLENIPADLWSTIPAGAPSHLAWQVGHMAVAQYGLMLFRQRGRAEGDIELMPGWLRKRYGKGTTPPTENVESKDQLLEILAKIHETCLREVPEMPLEQFNEPTDMPYLVYPTKLGALLFCPSHESIHAGQIGVLRRMLGFQPVR